MLPYKAVSSYLAFSPLLSYLSGLFSVALAVATAGAFPLGSRMLCVARTFLPMFEHGAIERPALVQRYGYYGRWKM